MMGRKPDRALDLHGTDAVLRAVICTCLGQYRHCEAHYLAAPDAETLHRARVSLRRLRSAIRLFQPLTGPLPALEAGLRSLATTLGDVRDLDVLLARAVPGALHDRLAAARSKAGDRAMATLHAASTRALLLDQSEWIVLHPPLPAASAREFAANRLDRLRRQVKKAGPALLAGDDEARHRLRKRVKRLRHGAELLGSLFAAARQQTRFLSALAPLLDALGALNDLVVGQAVLARIGASRARGAATLIDLAGQPLLLAQARKAHADLLSAPRFWR